MAHRSGSARLARRIGARIRVLREEAPLTQEKLAWECDLSKAHLSQVEAGRSFPSVPVLATIAKRLGLSIMDLVAVDPGDALSQLVEGVRRGDRQTVRKALEALGLGAVLAASEAEVSPVTAELAGGKRPGGRHRGAVKKS